MADLRLGAPRILTPHPHRISPPGLSSRKLLTPWQAQMLLAGHTAFILGKYKLLKELGRGGMGAVYQAEHSTLKRIVGIKVMARDILRLRRGPSLDFIARSKPRPLSMIPISSQRMTRKASGKRISW